METNKLYRPIAFTLFSLISLPILAQNIPSDTGNWDRQKFGNHRVVIRLMKNTDVAWVHIPWCRKDDNPWGKAIIMVDASSGKIIRNVYSGTIIFYLIK